MFLNAKYILSCAINMFLNKYARLGQVVTAHRGTTEAFQWLGCVLLFGRGLRCYSKRWPLLLPVEATYQNAWARSQKGCACVCVFTWWEELGRWDKLHYQDVTLAAGRHL